jgi:hypothetical protein
MAGIFGAMANLTQGDPETKGHLVVFDPQVFNRTKGLLTDWSKNQSQWKNLFSHWLEDFNAATPDYKKNATREIDYLDYLRNGGFEKTLAGLRVKESAADRAAMDNALDFASGATKRGTFLTGGTGSSADYARNLSVGKRISDDFLTRDAARERGDLTATTNLKLGTMGKMNEMLDRLVNRQLRPQDLTNSQLLQSIQALGGIQSLRMGSASPEFYKDLDFIQRLAGVFDTVVDTAGNLLSAYGGGGYQNGAETGEGTMPSAAQSSAARAEFNGGGYNPGGMPASVENPSVYGGTGRGVDYSPNSGRAFETPEYKPSWYA